MAGRGPPGERLTFGKGAAKAVDDYWEYTRYLILDLFGIIRKYRLKSDLR